MAASGRFTAAQGRKMVGFADEAERAWKGDFTFCVLADPQFGMFRWVAVCLR
jgi:hypothetical protein